MPRILFKLERKEAMPRVREGRRGVGGLKRSRPSKTPSPLTFISQINKDYSVRLPQSAIAWPMGTRVYWRINTARNLQLSPNPRGAFRNGKYQSSRVKRLGYWNPKSNSKTLAYQTAIARHRTRIQQRIRQATYQRNPRRKS